MIQWQCRQCGEGIEVPESLASDAVECPQCGVFSRPPEDLIPKVRTAPDTPPKPKRVKPDKSQPAKSTLKAKPDFALGATSKGLTAWGSIFALAGMIMGTNGFLLDTAPEGVHNTGLLNEQIIFVISGTGVFVLGALLIGSGTVVRALVEKDADAKSSDQSWSELTWAIIGILIVFVFVTALMLISREYA